MKSPTSGGAAGAAAASSPSGAEQNYKWNNDVQFPPLRPLNEFILDKARFDLPSFNDVQKWNNRIYANLLYFQSNYFLVLAVFLLLSTFLNPKAMTIGLVLLGLCGGFALLLLSTDQQMLNIRREHPYGVLFLLVAVGFAFISCLSFVIFTLFAIAFPILLVLIHASVRLRGLNNKLNQKFFEGVIRETVMSKILRVLNIEAKAD